MDDRVRWTDLTVQEMVTSLHVDHEMQVSKSVVRKLLKKHNYRRRKAQKRQTMKRVPHRNAQCETIERLRAEYEAARNPIISMDTKKKEHLGNFYREGHLYTAEELRTYDHDFVSFSDGVIIPHSFYDVRLNVGSIQLGTSHDTSKEPRRKQRGFQEEVICLHGGIYPPSPLTRMPFLPTASSGASWHVS